MYKTLIIGLITGLFFVTSCSRKTVAGMQAGDSGQREFQQGNEEKEQPHAAGTLSEKPKDFDTNGNHNIKLSPNNAPPTGHDFKGLDK